MAQKITRRHLKVGLGVIWTFVKKYRQNVGLLFAANIIVALGNGIVPYITGKLFDGILEPEVTWQLWSFTLPRIGWILIILLVIQSALAILDYYISQRRSYVSFAARFDYQVTAFSKLLELPMRFHKKHKMGGVTSKINEAGWGMQVLVGRFLGSVGGDILTVLVSIAVIFFIQPYIAVFSVAGLVVYLILSLFNLRKTADLESKYHAVWEKTYSNTNDSVMNVSMVKQATTEAYEQKKILRGFFTNLLPYWLRENDIWRSLSFYQRIVIIMMQTIVFLWSIHLVSTSVMTIGELIAFNSYLGMLFGPFVNVLNMSKTLQSGIINIYSVEKTLDVPTETYYPVNAVKLPEITGVIEFDRVGFGYDAKRPVLQDISFKVKAGDVVALVGESGVGKSTLIDLLSAYHFPTAGSLKIDGANIRKIDLRFLRSHIAIVPQEVVLFNDTILTNIKYGNFRASDQEVREAARKAHALSFIEKFPKKWKQLVGERGVKLSVGQKQRVAIARAILRNPSILILDEPTSALDAKSEHMIQASLNELMQGRTTFIVAHRLSTVRKADLILVFDGGRIVERGTHDELVQIENGKYRHLYELQIGLHN